MNKFKGIINSSQEFFFIKPYVFSLHIWIAFFFLFTYFLNLWKVNIDYQHIKFKSISERREKEKEKDIFLKKSSNAISDFGCRRCFFYFDPTTTTFFSFYTRITYFHRITYYFFLLLDRMNRHIQKKLKDEDEKIFEFYGFA